MLDHIASDDRHVSVNTQQMKRQTGTLHSSAGGYGPRHVRRSEIRQQFRRAGKWSNLRRITFERFAVYLVYALSLFRGKATPHLARESIDEKTAAHADLAMNAP